MTGRFTTLIFIISLTACSGRQNGESPNNVSSNVTDTIETFNSHKLSQNTLSISTDNLPICIDYSESSFDQSIHGSYGSYAKADKKYLKGKLLLSKRFVKQYLFSNADTVYIQNIWDGDTVVKELLDAHLLRNDYYVLDTILYAKAFLGIVYEHTQESGSEKYLCTFDTFGKLISNVTISFYLQSGTYTNDEGGRSPWWAETEGCVKRDLIIYISGADEKKYKIQLDGAITEIE